MSGSTARSDVVAPGVAIGEPFAPPAPAAGFLVDGVAAAPRVLAHRWDPDFTETVYALTDALRLTERKGIRAGMLCADWRFEGAGRVDVRAPAGAVADLRRLRFPLAGGRAVGGNLQERPFSAWFARHAPRLECASAELAEVYAYRWFVVYRDSPGSLPLQLRELRWMREASVQARLDAWRGEGDAFTPAIEFGEHHQVTLWRAREVALEAVLAAGGFAALPAGLGDAVAHWGMVRSLGGEDLRDVLAARHLHGGYFRELGPKGPLRSVLGWESALPFLYDDFGRVERVALARAVDAWGLRGSTTAGPVSHHATSWILHALGAVAGRTREPALIERFARAWKDWTASQGGCVSDADGRADAFDSAWLDTFLRAVVLDRLVDVGRLRIEGVPWKDEEIAVER